MAGRDIIPNHPALNMREGRTPLAMQRMIIHNVNTYLLKFNESKVAHLKMKAFANGAFLILPRSYYEHWNIMIDEAADAISSHTTLEHPKRMGIILYGIYKPTGETAIQMEHASVDKHPIQHLWDYVSYLFTGRNIGPLGTSHFTEATPLR